MTQATPQAASWAATFLFPPDLASCVAAAELSAERWRAWRDSDGVVHGPNLSGTDVTVEVAGSGGAWTEHVTAELARRSRSAGANAAFAHLAKLGGEYVTRTDLSRVSGLPVPNLNAQLTWLGRHAKLVRGIEGWPLTKKTLPGGEPAYAMPAKIAEWWASA